MLYMGVVMIEGQLKLYNQIQSATVKRACNPDKKVNVKNTSVMADLPFLAHLIHNLT